METMKRAAFTLIEALVCMSMIVTLLVGTITVCRFTLVQQVGAHASEANEMENRRAALELEYAMRTASSYEISDSGATPQALTQTGDILKVIGRPTILANGEPIFPVKKFLFVKDNLLSTSEYLAGSLSVIPYYQNRLGAVVTAAGVTAALPSPYVYSTNVKVKIASTHNRPFGYSLDENYPENSRMRYRWWTSDKYGEIILDSIIPYQY